MQDRLERTHQRFTENRSSLNDSHRARYLLNGILRCDCCGGGYTLVGKDRYGCFNRKSKGPSVCDSRKIITRLKLETRVLARIRAGLLTPEMAAQFAAEMKRLIEAGEAAMSGEAKRHRLIADLTSVEKSIARILDRLESDEPGEALMAQLRERETERGSLRGKIAELDAAGSPQPLPPPRRSPPSTAAKSRGWTRCSWARPRSSVSGA